MPADPLIPTGIEPIVAATAVAAEAGRAAETTPRVPLGEAWLARERANRHQNTAALPVSLNGKTHHMLSALYKVDYGIPLDEAIEDILAYYLYVFSGYVPAGDEAPEDFREAGFELMTGFGAALRALKRVGATLEDDTITFRARQFMLEMFVERERWVDPSLPFGVARHRGRSELGVFPVAAEQRPHQGNHEMVSPEIRGRFARGFNVRINTTQTFTLHLNSGILEDFADIARTFQLPAPTAAVFAIAQATFLLRLYRKGRTQSFREDLFSTGACCRLLGMRLVDLSEVLELNILKARTAAEVLTQRGCALAANLPPDRDLIDIHDGSLRRQRRATQVPNKAQKYDGWLG